MNPVLRYSAESQLFGLFQSHAVKDQAKRRGFTWDERGFWKTASPFQAVLFAKFADDSAKAVLRPYLQAIAESEWTDSPFTIPAPEGLEYLPFQKAGIIYASKRFNCLLADQPGLGKSVEAIGVANYLGLKRLLVICPAGLRLNWCREIEKWHLHNPGVEPVLDGKTRINLKSSVVISYDLACKWNLKDIRYNLVICDEGHYVKQAQAERTKKVLGTRGNPGLIHLAPHRLVLTGTPVPNRVNEIYPILRTLAPEVIDRMNYRAFLNYYAVTIPGQYSEQIVGIRHEEELYCRLRAGLMVRRLKKDVLKDLPEKQYKMVVFPASGNLLKVLKRESQFSAAEIIKHGAPVGTALPEIRHEMGIEKAPLVVTYVSDLLEEGVSKVVVYAHHRAVVEILAEGLREYRPVVVTGQTSAVARQEAVDEFQRNPSTRVFIGNIVAAGTGITLTAAHDVVFAEGSWVPGENEQAEDRVHRVGQHDSVLIHVLVVEKSLDAQILGSAARKRSDIAKILDGGEDGKSRVPMSNEVSRGSGWTAPDFGKDAGQPHDHLSVSGMPDFL